MAARYCIGLDVGSVTVKLAVFDEGPQPIWSRYERHGTKQPECVLEMLQTCEAELPGLTGAPARIFLTGSGGLALAPLLGGRFVQEVHAVALAVERLHPECGSAVELGGQDAKILIFQTDPSTGRRSRITSMNDKCAGGTGAVIDKLGAKLGIAKDELGAMPFHGLKLHPVAGKCGVFAETDIVGLQKQGVPREELIASLFQAIVMQNLSVLTRGNLLRPEVLLLGGPNCYLRGLRECWETAIPLLWAERGVDLPRDVDPVSLIRVPANGHLFAAIGAVEFGRRQEEDAASYLGWRTLEQHLRRRPAAGPASSLTDSADQLRQLGRQFSIREFVPATFRPGEVVEAFLGVDGGSTSTKAVLLSKTRPRQVLAKSYRLSHGNPIDDAKGVVGDLEHYVRAQGAQLRILGAGTTGYAREMLRTALSADIALVETVAHTEAALHFHPDVDVICDVGGQDIKIIILKDGKVSDFRLNTQCSAGNGYFLQSTAESFGIRVSDIAEVALAARRSPDFGSGCAVFLQTDIVNFQRQGWKPDEILAGLCRVLPRNIWLYVAQLPNLSGLGRYFLLQGGTQHNLAAVKAQADFIRSRFPAGDQPQVVVHEHCGEAGAIGAALEAARLWGRGRETGFVGLDSLAALTYSTRRDESTRCHFCSNECLRTFVDIHAPAQDSSRFILATCEKGEVEDEGRMREIRSATDDMRRKNPDLSAYAARAAFQIPSPPAIDPRLPRWPLTAGMRARRNLVQRRATLRIGMPRVLNFYSVAPLFTAYFRSLGIAAKNLVFSSHTTEELYAAGGKRGSVDPCFPSKVAIPHVHNLIAVAHATSPLHVIFFPMLDCLDSPLRGTPASRACPTVTATPAAVKAAFARERDEFHDHGIRFVDTFLNLSQPALLERQMYADWAPILGLSPRENRLAVEAGYRHLAQFQSKLRQRGKDVLASLEREGRLGIVLLGRPYHNDPGLHHGIPEELQKLGYPILTQDALPMDSETLNRLFGAEVRAGLLPDPLSVTDVWKNAYSENTSRKVWAAKFTARHPNLVALEISSFKCGHDAPVYSLIEQILEASATPYFSFKDIDENKPAGAMRLRLETMHYFLTRYQEDLNSAAPQRSSPVRLEWSLHAAPKIDVPLAALQA